MYASLILNYLRDQHPSRNPFSAQKSIKPVSNLLHWTLTVSKPFASFTCRLIFSKVSRFV